MNNADSDGTVTKLVDDRKPPPRDSERDSLSIFFLFSTGPFFVFVLRGRPLRRPIIQILSATVYVARPQCSDSHKTYRVRACVCLCGLFLFLFDAGRFWLVSAFALVRVPLWSISCAQSTSLPSLFCGHGYIKMKQPLKPVKMRHFYKHVLSGIVFWLLLSQSLSLFNSSSAASTSRSDLQDVADSEEDNAELNNNAISTNEIEEEEEEGSEGRYFGDLLKIVKREIREGETGRSSSGIFNTTLAFTIPLFSFSLPDRATAGKDYTKQAALSLFGLAIIGGIAIMPYVWTARSALGKKTIVETEARAKKDEAASSILPMLTNVASFAGLDAKTCVQRSVCETYRNPERYGYLVLPIRYFMLSPQSRENDKPSGYQLAADFGRQETEECERRYRCAFSLIGAANFLVSYFYPSSTA